jgi:hypothetical protein
VGDSITFTAQAQGQTPTCLLGPGAPGFYPKTDSNGMATANGLAASLGTSGGPFGAEVVEAYGTCTVTVISQTAKNSVNFILTFTATAPAPAPTISPGLQKVSGDKQVATTSLIASGPGVCSRAPSPICYQFAPFVASLADANGKPLANTPVTFAATSGAPNLVCQMTAGGATTYAASTTTSGTASANAAGTGTSFGLLAYGAYGTCSVTASSSSATSQLVYTAQLQSAATPTPAPTVAPTASPSPAPSSAGAYTIAVSGSATQTVGSTTDTAPFGFLFAALTAKVTDATGKAASNVIVLFSTITVTPNTATCQLNSLPGGAVTFPGTWANGSPTSLNPSIAQFVTVTDVTGTATANKANGQSGGAIAFGGGASGVTCGVTAAVLKAPTTTASNTVNYTLTGQVPPSPTPTSVPTPKPSPTPVPTPKPSPTPRPTPKPGSTLPPGPVPE